jgi:hypothetical protein
MKYDYTNEQKAYNGGLIDKFVEYTGFLRNISPYFPGFFYNCER